MELVKKKVPVDDGRCQGNIQLTLDDDFNVPDRKPDVRQIIAEQGEIHTNEVTPAETKIQLDGVLQFQIFYVSEQGGQMQSLSGEIPFREWVNLGQECQGSVMLKWTLEDLKVELIHSRKISVQAIVSAKIQGEGGHGEEAGVDLLAENGVELHQRSMTMTQQKMARKDTFRIKDEYMLPSSRSNILEPIYQEITLRGVETRLLEDKISLKGELHFMYFYYGEEGDRMEYLEWDYPFSGNLDCPGCTPDMISDIDVSIMKKDIQVKADEDGEERILDVEVILDLSMKLYGEEEVSLLEDFYAMDRILTPVRKELAARELFGRYSHKQRVNSRVELPENAPAVLQLCGSSGMVKIDETYRENGKIHVEGVVELPILYLTTEEEIPVNAVKGVLPFEEWIEAEDLREEDIFEVRPELDQIAVSLLNGREIDAKATVNLETMVFRKQKMSVIVDYEEKEIPEEELSGAPALIGYYVQPGDSWWTIGKKYRVPVEWLRKFNPMISAEPEMGMKVLVVREPFEKQMNGI